MADKDFILEIGTEEIPARFLPPAARQIEEGVKKLLAEQRIAAKSVSAYVTPCRLVIHVSQIAASAETRVIERTGPPWDSAFGPDKKPTAALLGFLKSANAAEKDVIQVQKKDRIFVGVKIEEKGRPTPKILLESIPAILSSIHFPKNMRWRAGDSTQFARPVRRMFSLFHGRPFALKAFDLTASALSAGNKFFFPKSFRPKSAEDFIRSLEKQMVILPSDKRRQKILREAQTILSKKRLKSDMAEELVSEVAHLTEYPTVLLGEFDPAFLTIPDAILRSAMSHHQRYFPVTTAGGKLAPHFLVVRNGPADPKKIVSRGNARVLAARFSDAKYFFETDRKKKLADRIDGLKGVVYLQGLGTLHDRARRIRDLLVILSPRIGIDIDLTRYADAAYLCKADLLTEAVKEFPELQGVMGRTYAQLEGQPAEISEAIFEHYQPRGAQDPLPASPLGALMALADKFELLFGGFSVGIRPTASADPYGMRRAAIGIARILLARGWHLSVAKLAESAAPIFPNPDALKKCSPEILDFFRGRLESILRETYPIEHIVSCIQITDDPCEVAGKVEAFSKVAAEGKDQWLTLLRTAKRAFNIVKSEKNIPPLNPGGFQQDEERALFQAFQNWKTRVQSLPERKYTDRLRAILQMAAPLQAFFEKVFVMVEDPALRANRLALICAISDAFRSYAEFDKISVGE